MIPKRLEKQMARHPDPLSEIVREGEYLAKQRRIRNTEKDLNALRESVRRLVGEWREKQKRDRNEGEFHVHRADSNMTEICWRGSDTFKACADELSALIDTPETPPQAEGREGQI